MPQFDALTITPPPGWAAEGALIYSGLVVVVSLFAGRAAGKLALAGLAVGLGPLGVLMMPRVALAVGLLVAFLLVRRYGWRWLLATLTFLGILGMLAVRNLESLSAAQLAMPAMVLGGLLDAVISTIIIWGLLAIGWLLTTVFAGKFLLLVRSGLAGERQHRAQLAEIQAAKAGRTRAWQQGLKLATGGRYQPPTTQAAGGGQRRRRRGGGGGGGGAQPTVPTSRPAGPTTPPPKPRTAAAYTRRPAAQRARHRRVAARARRSANP